jgi:hypothetical protein
MSGGRSGKAARGSWALAVVAALAIAGPAAAVGVPEEITVTAITPDRQSVIAQVPAPSAEGGTARAATLKLADPEDALRLADARPGDIARAEIDQTVSPGRILRLGEVRRPVDWRTRLIILGVVAAGLLGAVWIASEGRPARLVVGADNRFSNSQTQLALWSGVVALFYLAAVIARVVELGWSYVGGVDLPNNLTVLTGFSALAFGGAKVVGGQKLDAAASAAAANNGAADYSCLDQAAAANGEAPRKLAAARPRLIPDLFQNDAGQTDLGDIQMIFITLTAVVIFALSAFNWLGALGLSRTVALPDIDTALMSGFGIGQGAYLVKKAAMPLGKG